MFNALTLSRKWPFIGKQTSVREELTGLIETSIRQTDTEFDNQEGLLLRNMLGLRDITAEDVMVPRADIVAIDISEGFEAAFRQISAAAHSRVPAYEGNQDNVRGMLHIKDLVAHSLSPEQPVLRDLLRPVLFVSPAIRLLDLLQEMRLKRQHLALVIDEFGGVDGLITIEDLVEEIVGEIEDEHDDTDAPQFEIINEDIAVADARLEMEELEAHIGITLECD
ncbi:MAG: CBS domain-containing protein, partial [Alphaproteobacteria bacterium]